MPWISDEPPASEAGKIWHEALERSLSRRVRPEQLHGILRDLMRRHRMGGASVADVFLRFRAKEEGADDPLLFRYAAVLLKDRCMSPSHLLDALLRTSKYLQPATTEPPKAPRTGMPTCEERMIILITQLLLADELSIRLEDAHNLFRVVAHWMHAVSEYETGKQLDTENVHTLDYHTFGLYESLGSLAITSLGNPVLRQVVKAPWWKKRRPVVVREMENFDANVLIWMGSQVGGRLRALTNMPPYIECDKYGRPVLSDQQILNSIPGLPLQNTRAGLFIWLNACLTARPLTDDMSVLAFLQARYSGDNQSSAVGLIQASFDVLTNALLRKETDHDLKVVRSFICNKVPSLLSSLGSFMMAPASVEGCIQAAFESITMDAVPPITAGSAEGRDKLKLARREFLLAATLHGLLSESTMSAILMEPSVSMPKVTRYTKEGLFSQCNNNVSRLEPLIDELDGMVGNASAISGCLVDVISNLCSNKDTMALKTVCNLLVKKNAVLDIVFQYTQPASLLTSICSQLNDWTHDHEQTEFTPAYEEFASMLLFVLTVMHRYDLQYADLGLGAGNTFIAQILQQVAESKKPAGLSIEQSSQLSKWVEGLYAVDESGDTNGISDEVMRQCPPQDFYQLVPTLFEQSVLACKSNALPLKQFKGGIELLLEPFLLPCLVGGLSWLAKHSWEDHGDAEVLLQALDKLLRQNSASQDAKSMHNAVLGIVADPLGNTLEAFISRKPNQRTEKTATGLLEMLRPHQGRRRTLSCPRTELSAWTASNGGGLAEHLRVATQEQIIWSSNMGPSPPPKYTHRSIAAATSVLGIDATLDVLVTELKEQTTIGNGPLALDICSAMVCAPTPSSGYPGQNLGGSVQSSGSQMSLRDALRLRTSNPQELLQLPSSSARALVHLSRAVEAQSAITPITQLPMADMPMQSAAADQVMAELGLTNDNLAPAGADLSMDTGMQLDAPANANFTNADIEALNQPDMHVGNGQQATAPDLQRQTSAVEQQQQDDIFANLGVDLSQTAPNPTQTGQNQEGSNQGAEEDIFAGLGMNMDLDLGDDFDFS